MVAESSMVFSRLLRIASLLVFVGAAMVGIDAHAQNIERGRALYENHCQKCHDATVHGRKNRLALSIGELRDIVDQWQRNQGLRWRDDEIDDVVRYLASTRYFFNAARER